jgi:hypothetical protein
MFFRVPLTATSVEGPLGTFGIMLVVGGFFTFVGLFLGVPRLEELRHRGAWVPPGTDRHPALVAVALTLLSMAAVVAITLILIWVGPLFGLVR